MPTTMIYDTLTVNNILCTCKNYETKDPVHHESDKKTSKPRNKIVLTEDSYFRVSWTVKISGDLMN